jgi:flagellin-specific chaperone FliS
MKRAPEVKPSMGITIDYETADRITISNLKSLSEMLKDENMNERYSNVDKAYNDTIINSINNILDYMGAADEY